PAGAYGRSTFATRDHYRHEVEQLARRSGASELDVARRVVERARTAPPSCGARGAHVGYYLIDSGRAALEAELGYHPTPAQAVQRVILRRPTAFYLGSLAATTAAGVAVGLRLLDRGRRTKDESWLSAGVEPSRSSKLPSFVFRLSYAALLTLPASALAKELVDRCVARILSPRVLPRLDLRDGIPAELRTMVVIPTLLLTPDSVHGQIEALEVLALANEDPHLHFALLSDFADAPAAEMPDDSGLLVVARAGVEQLNARYGTDRFFLLHRRRVWNERQACFMGWERKRGKLEEFNHLLSGADDTTFAIRVGDMQILPQIRYVITLDADTQLPRDAGRALIGTLAHPLNQAEVDPQTRRVVDGYGVLQPRVGIDLPSAMRSHFARIFAGNVGIDPYTTAVSDVYMDLFGEGIYAGKGIYDPAVLRATLDRRFPENTLLSHDLIEGCYARTGLLSDVELLDSYPATYAAFAARQHRWVRGDWQIAAWLLPWTPSANGQVRNVLPPIARFKIFDNLRRSLIPPATVALLAAGWLRGHDVRRALAMTGYALLPLALPEMLDFGGWVLDRRGWRNLTSNLQNRKSSALRFGLNVTFLPERAASNLDAIGRTLVRLLITRRNLLEWETAAQAHGRLTQSSGDLLRRTAPAAAIGALAAICGARRLVATWPAAAPVVADWLAAPAVAAWLDQPSLKPARPLGDTDRLLLRRLARATWAYFEQFVTADANNLAPDNFQETPSPLIAYRTSPTNIGLQLLADLAAYDFGYIGLLDLTERTERVVVTVAHLERYRGHLLNWYDTQTLRPLPPAYVSTVDSGNLLASLTALVQGIAWKLAEPMLGPQALHGLGDALAALRAMPDGDLPASAAGARAA
ncbi:MAG TPA: glycosyl transferase, partial [Roseiflexaceae bacterium]